MDIKNFIKRKRFWAGILLAQFLLFYLLSKSETAIQLAEYFFEIKKSAHQKLFALFTFSVGDVFYTLLTVLLIFFFFKLFKKKDRNSALVTLLIIFNISYFLYQLFWGMLYFQKPLIRKMSTEEPTLQETKMLAEKYLKRCIKDRSLIKEDRNGVFKVWDMREIENEILRNQGKIPSTLSLKKSTGIHSFKKTAWGSTMNLSGILGYYNPFTAEAQYNPHLPSTYTPFTLAHESAHQLGFAREQEANFIGFLIGRNSENIELRYSTNYFTLKSLLNALTEKNPEFVTNIIRQYSPGMKRDRLYEHSFRQRHSGILDDFFGLTNDLFLKSNQQDGSVTYSYFVDLLIRYERP